MEAHIILMLLKRGVKQLCENCCHVLMF